MAAAVRRPGERTRRVGPLPARRRELRAGLPAPLPEPQASLGRGILLGERSALPQDLTDALNATSTSHIIALSGYNVTLVAGMVIGGFAWLRGAPHPAPPAP